MVSPAFIVKARDLKEQGFIRSRASLLKLKRGEGKWTPFQRHLHRDSFLLQLVSSCSS